MRPGLEQDDIWVMVEDEFLSTAHLYTSHLHKAEYLRLKKLARAQNASTIQNIARPVDDRTEQSMESRRKMEGATQRIMGERAMRNLQGDMQLMGRGEDEDEEEDPWMRDPRLKGLMTQRENSTQLSKIAGIRSKTRASAGYAQASQLQVTNREVDNMDEAEVPVRRAPVKPKTISVDQTVDEDEDSDSDDLGGPARSYAKPLPRPTNKVETSTRTASRTSYPPTTSNATSEKRMDSFHSLKAKPSTERVQSRPNQSSSSSANLKNVSSDISMDLDDFDGFPKRQTLPNRMAGRLGRRKDGSKDDEKKRPSLKAEEVPTFLF
jgi:hypothetical protein